MSYGDNPVDTSLFYGDLLVDFFDQDNNLVNPPSDVGFFLYNLFGKAFDDSQEIINDILLNLDPFTCKLPYLNIIAMEFKLKKDPSWSDDKWRAAVISYYYNLETIAGIEFVLNLINEYYNKSEDEQTELDRIVVDGFYGGFYLSDKFDSFSSCSDKTSEFDSVSNFHEGTFNVDFKNNPSNGIIDELLAIIEDGGIN